VTGEAGVLSESRAVLIGVSDYDHPEFPPIRAARNSLQAMRALLADPALCGWPPGQVTVIENPASAADLADQVADLAESTTGVLLLYYVGHGALSPRGELCLTVTSTRPSRPKFGGLAWENVAEILRVCPARARLVILDCCFAGQAIEALSGDGDPGLADIAHVEGVYTLTATTRNRTAHVPPADQQGTACTSFTGELRDLIRSGIPGKPPRLTFSDIYPVLRQRLRAKALPVPNQRGTDTAYQFPFTANAAHKDREPAWAGRARATRILGDAERIAQSITDEFSKAEALAEVVRALAATDPDRAERIAQSISQSITSEFSKGEALAHVARALAATDPDRAERIAQSITSGDLEARSKAEALAYVARALAATDPQRAARLSADAERIAQSITNKRSKAEALTHVARALAATDPDHAQYIAQLITRKDLKAEALTHVAVALAATDPDRAQRIAQSITRKVPKAEALTHVAVALAATDPDRATRLSADAERIAQSITTEGQKERVLRNVARTLAAIDPDRATRILADAERIAQLITREHLKVRTLVRIAEACNQG
jgi:truncated hemoglobin YjbI